ncbi:MAG TPA: hypothetical protein VMR52_10620 [Dehalococcoidia bacterium]|nr:hypothetical protein [Dehalococcoidia bacterium]
MKIVALARSATVNPLAALTAAGLIAVILGILAGGDASTDTAANGIDCRTITATPTVSATPSPSPPWVPSSSELICNDTNQNVNDLHIIIDGQIETPSPGSFNVD